jgi:hypothetical protein
MTRPAVRRAPIIGWRVWHVDDGPAGARLLSWSHPAEWPARERMEASCTPGHASLRCRRRHAAPEPGHACGLYALHSRERAEALMDGLFALVPAGCNHRAVALGRVSLWGRVIENTGGWRAQYGYPYDLHVYRGGDDICRRLRDEYAVDVSLD